MRGYLNTLLSLGAKSTPIRTLIERLQPLGLLLARFLGASSGFLGYEIEGSSGVIVKLAFVASALGYFTPIVPAVIAARAIAEGRFGSRGLVSTDQQVDPELLIDYLRSLGVELVQLQ